MKASWLSQKTMTSVSWPCNAVHHRKRFVSDWEIARRKMLKDAIRRDIDEIRSFEKNPEAALLILLQPHRSVLAVLCDLLNLYHGSVNRLGAAVFVIILEPWLDWPRVGWRRRIPDPCSEVSYARPPFVISILETMGKSRKVA